MRKLVVLMVLVVGIVAALSVAVASDEPGYHISGDYFETCSCNPSCPCIFKSDPTRSHCKASLVWHIEKGHWGETDLSGTDVVVVLVSSGNMGKEMGKFKGALYLDGRASDEQRKALGALFHARFGGMFGSMAGPEVATIEYSQEGEHYAVKIGDVLDAAIEPIKGPDGTVSKISGAPFAMTDPLWVAQSVRHHYNDPDLDSWDMGAGRSAFFAEFDYASAAEN